MGDDPDSGGLSRKAIEQEPDVSLSDSDTEYLEEPYEPVEVSGHE